jgi:hypothetical protein
VRPATLPEAVSFQKSDPRQKTSGKRSLTMTTDRRVSRLFWAFALIGGGLWLLLLNFNLLDRFQPTAQYILAGALAVLGIGFFGAFLRRRAKWWRLIPGWLLLTLAAMVLVSTLSLADVSPDEIPLIQGPIIAATLFWGLAVAFLHVYLLQRATHWWAIIPSGFMLVLGVVIAAAAYITRLESLAALLSIGMGLVFVALYGAARAQQGWWPLIPATVLILFGIVSFTTGTNVQNVLLNLWPVLLIIIGIYLGWLAWRKQPAAERMEISTAQPPRRPKPPARPDHQTEGVLGAYSGPVPGATIDILDEHADEREDNAPAGSGRSK